MATNQIVTQSEPQPEQIKVPHVICRQKVQEFGDITIPAPTGVTVEERTGKLVQDLTLVLAGVPSLRTVTILPGKLINMGVVPAKLLVDDKVVIPMLEIPFQSVVDCPGAEPGDLVQKHDFQVEGFAISPIRLLSDDLKCLNLHLILKVVIQTCIIVAEETILRVQATRPFCG